MSQSLSHNVKRLSHLDLVGGGQIVVEGDYAFVGHMKPPHGTSIVNIADPRKPVVVAELPTGSTWSHTHKVRVQAI